MILDIDKNKKRTLEKANESRLQSELKNYRVQNRKATIKISVFMTLFVLFIVGLVVGIHYLKAGALSDAYLKKHAIRFLIAETILVFIPLISDILLKNKTEEEFLNILGRIPKDEVTFEITSTELIQLQNGEEFVRYALKDISDIKKDGTDTVFTYIESEKKIPDYFVPSLYDALKEAKENYKERPERSKDKIVKPKKLKERTHNEALQEKERNN